MSVMRVKRKMTRAEFWKVLATLKRKPWVEDGDPRHIWYDSNDFSWVCPLCAVANKRLRVNRYRLSWGEAADALGLDIKFAGLIQRAADGGESPEVLPYRRKLIRTLGLKGVK